MHPDAVSAVKPRIKATTILLLRRDMVLPPFRLRTICCQRADLMPETHVQYDGKELDHEYFPEITANFFWPLSFNRYDSDPPLREWVYRSESVCRTMFFKSRSPGSQLAQGDAGRVRPESRLIPRVSATARTQTAAAASPSAGALRYPGSRRIGS